MENQVSALLEKWGAASGAEGSSCDVSSSAVRLVKVPIPATGYRELQALGSVLDRDFICLAGELLAAALADVLSRLPAEQQARLAEAKTRLDQTRQAAELEAARFNTGGT